MKQIKDLKKDLDPELDEEFEYQYLVYKNDYRVKESLSAIFGVKLKRAYVSYPDYPLKPKKNNLDWDAKNMILVREDGNFILMDNSEWSKFELLKK